MVVDDVGWALFTFPIMERRAFLNDKLGGKPEEIRDDGQYCWVVISGSRVSIQRGKCGSF